MEKESRKPIPRLFTFRFPLFFFHFLSKISFLAQPLKAYKSKPDEQKPMARQTPATLRLALCNICSISPAATRPRRLVYRLIKSKSGFVNARKNVFTLARLLLIGHLYLNDSRTLPRKGIVQKARFTTHPM